MNNLFTLKTRLIFLSLLICQLSLKAQITTGTNTVSARTTDTTLAKKGDTSFAIKADTSLAIKAGSTMIIKSDTTLVINGATAVKQTDPALTTTPDMSKKTDVALVANTANTLAKKADVTIAAKPDASLAKTPDVTIAAKPDTSLAKKPDPSITKTTTIAPPTDGLIEVKNASDATREKGQVESKGVNGVIMVRDTTTSSMSIRSDSAGVQKPGAPTVTPAQDPAVNAAPAATNNTNSPATTDTKAAATDTKADPAVSASADTTKKAATDTTKKAATDTLVKKSDTTLVKRSDTTVVQKDTTTAITEIQAKNVFLEVGGAGLAISANYDTRFHKERNGWGYRVGVGFFTSGGNTVETVPFQVNYLIGQHSSMIEFGAGTTFLNSVGTNVGNSKWEFDKVTGFIATATIGYRYQPTHKGINFRIAFTPILYDEGIVPAGGISVGYTFK